MWQDSALRCRHFLAVLRKWKEIDYANLLRQGQISTLFKYKSLHNLYTPNIVPVVVDTISYDGKTKPPIRAKRQAGRPKVKRYRRRSELLDPSQSKLHVHYVVCVATIVAHAKLLTRRQLQPFLSPEIDVLAKTE